MQTPRRRSRKSVALHAWIAEQILSFLANNRIRQGARLVEEKLADDLKVSRTPVRSALAQLVDLGIIEKRHHQGYFVAVSPEFIGLDALAGGAGSDRSAETVLCRRLIEDRLSGGLPQRVTERVLLARYGITRTQLAGVLLKLCHEDWIVRLPGKGWEFVPLTATKAANQHAYQCRILIEPAVLLQKGFHLPEARLADLRNEQQAMLESGQGHLSPAQRLRTAFSFHQALVFAAGNPYFNEAIKGVGRQSELQCRDLSLDSATLSPIFSDHIKILDLIRTQQMEKASVLMRCHLYREQKLISNDSRVPLTAFYLE